MTEPVWLLRPVLEAVHDMQLTEHGGLPGLRNSGLLDSALARPPNLFAHGETDAHGLAAAYAFGLARNHPFVDGNKRIAFLAAFMFLRLNGWLLSASEARATTMTLALAAGDIEEAELTRWVCKNAVRILEDDA